MIGDLSPAAFKGLAPDRAGRIEDMIHFSLTTLTTVGYGDILPLSPLARSIADLEALIGQLFPATLLARLVGLQISRSGAAARPNPERLIPAASPRPSPANGEGDESLETTQLPLGEKSNQRRR